MKKSSLLILSIIVLLGSGCNKDKKKGEPSIVYISKVIASPTANESVTLRNNSGETADLTGWTIGDLNDPNAYTIPNNTSLGNKSSMNFSATTLGLQINDSDETIYLKDDTGDLIHSWKN